MLPEVLDYVSGLAVEIEEAIEMYEKDRTLEGLELILGHMEDLVKEIETVQQFKDRKAKREARRARGRPKVPAHSPSR